MSERAADGHVRAWTLDEADGAGRAAQIRRAAERGGLVKIVDRAVVSWPVGAKCPTTSHLEDDEGRMRGGLSEQRRTHVADGTLGPGQERAVADSRSD